jgi:hypothetical protein
MLVILNEMENLSVKDSEHLSITPIITVEIWVLQYQHV